MFGRGRKRFGFLKKIFFTTKWNIIRVRCPVIIFCCLVILWGRHEFMLTFVSLERTSSPFRVCPVGLIGVSYPSAASVYDLCWPIRVSYLHTIAPGIAMWLKQHQSESSLTMGMRKLKRVGLTSCGSEWAWRPMLIEKNHKQGVGSRFRDYCLRRSFLLVTSS